MRKPPKQTPPPPPPRDVRVIEILGAEYLIDWGRVSRGASFFLPTTVTADQVRKILVPYAAALNFEFAVHTRCEFGRYGVRVWRTY
jgi:hypothetical protein